MLFLLNCAVHLGGGLFGVLAGPMFSKTDGVFYSGKIETFQKFGWNLLGSLAYFGWHSVAVTLITVGFACCKLLVYPKESGGQYLNYIVFL